MSASTTSSCAILTCASKKPAREYARVTMPITENHKNGMGVAHGGAIFFPGRRGLRLRGQCRQRARRGQPVHHHRIPAPRHGQPPQAEARLVRNGAHVLTYDVNVYDGSGAHVARCMATGFQTNVPLPR